MSIFNELIGFNNPFDGINAGFFPAPTFADIDGDGDLDAIVGELDGTLNFFENIGDSTNPSFTEQTGTNNPFDGINVGYSSSPTFADIDGDGDLDAIVGEQGGTLKFFENTGDSTNPSFTEQTGTNNPFDGIDVGGNASPTFLDIDGDGDLDAIVGEFNGTLKFFENTGDSTNPSFTEQTGSNNPFDGFDVSFFAAPTFADIDGDGDLDAIVGENIGTLNFLENTGDSTNPSFTEQTGTNNPFDGIDVGAVSSPTFADIDNDGDLDAIVGEGNGTLKFFLNAEDPFDGFDVGGDSVPTFVDIDNDGDLDLFVGENAGLINFFENVGDVNTPRFAERVGSANPFDGVDIGSDASPAFIDIDGDSDLDALVGDTDGNLNFFENTGDVNTATFVERTGPANPFDGVDLGYDSAPIFADIDGDGDLDLFVGADNGLINFFENTGDVNAPIFEQRLGLENPFDGINVGRDSHIALIDVDNDGDLDAVVGEDADDDLNFFENTGDVNTPVFIERTGLENPFNGIDVIDVGGEPVPTFSDIDGDGDQDLLLGAEDGTLTFFENTGPRETEINLVDGNLTITDTNGGNSPDTLTLTETDTTLLIEDPNQAFQVSDGVVLNSFNSAEIPLASITEAIAINTLGGNDSITAEITLDLSVNAGSGNDTLLGGSGSDTLLGQNGNDSIIGGVGDDSLNGGFSNDTLEGEDGSDTLNGAGGSDLILGAEGQDSLLGANGRDTLLGGEGDDTLSGNNGLDSLRGESGNDLLFGGISADTLNGGSGDDTLNGGSANDRITGDSGNDRLVGNTGNDTLIGGAGNDLLIASSGRNLLNGTNTASQGVNELDTLVGAVGQADQFILGDNAGVYYLDDGASFTSLARISNFESLDTLVLNGSSSDYRIADNNGNSVLFRLEDGPDDAIAIIENTVGLNLNSDQFNFV